MPVLCRFFFQRHTMSISDSFYSRHNSKIHQLPHLREFQFPALMMISCSDAPWSVDSLLLVFFFRSSEITVSFEISRFRLMSLTPQLFMVCFSICSFTPGFHAFYVYSYWKLFPHLLQRYRWVPFSLRPFLTRSSAPQCRQLISIYSFIMTEQHIDKN